MLGRFWVSGHFCCILPIGACLHQFSISWTLSQLKNLPTTKVRNQQQINNGFWNWVWGGKLCERKVDEMTWGCFYFSSSMSLMMQTRSTQLQNITYFIVDYGRLQNKYWSWELKVLSNPWEKSQKLKKGSVKNCVICFKIRKHCSLKQRLLAYWRRASLHSLHSISCLESSSQSLPFFSTSPLSSWTFLQIQA